MPIFFLTCCGDAEGNPEKCSDDRDRVIHRHVVVVLFFLRRHNKLFVSFFPVSRVKEEGKSAGITASFVHCGDTSDRKDAGWRRRFLFSFRSSCPAHEPSGGSTQHFLPATSHISRWPVSTACLCENCRLYKFVFFFFFSACVPNRPWSVSWMAGTTTTTTQEGKYGEYKKVEREGIVTLHEMRAASQTAWRRLNYATKRLARTRRTAASPKTGGWVGPPHSTRAPFPLSLFLFFFILLPFSFFYDNNNKQPVKKKKKKTSLRR